MTTLVIDHLWQSTLFAAACGALAWLLRGREARVRYAVWLAASLKFVIPFAALIALGRLAAPSWLMPHTARTLMITVVAPISVPLMGGPARLALPGPAGAAPAVGALAWVLVPLWAAGTVVVLARWVADWRRIQAIVRGAVPLDSGREIDSLRRLQTVHARPAVRLVATNGTLEPGIVGIVRPMLLWPRAVTARLTDGELDAILAHELVHATRRDNLVAFVQMLVSAAFWFHPFVHWISARLLDERERACDEAVIERGEAPDVYATGLLRTCEFCIDRQAICVAGVSGADLRTRVVRIAQGETGAPLGRWQRAALVAGVAACLVGPLAAGVFTAGGVHSVVAVQIDPTKDAVFEVASVKPSGPNARAVGINFAPGGRLTVTGATLRTLIGAAYGEMVPLQDFQIVGGPRWLDADRFDISAKAEGDLKNAPSGPPPLMFAMLRHLLSERFGLQVHREMREASIYALTMANADGRLGPRLRPSAIDCMALAAARQLPPPAAPGEPPACGMRMAPGQISAGGVTLAALAGFVLSRQVNRVVVDRTGLTGAYDWTLQWTPESSTAAMPPASPAGGLDAGDPAPGAPPAGSDVSIFTAVREQLGLKLESERGPVEILVVDRAEPPTPN